MSHDHSPPAGADDPADQAALVRAALREDYEILRVLGHGGAATVHLARDPKLDVLRAIKVLRPDRAEDETARRRFDREARAAASLASHPNVVAVYRYGVLGDGSPYVVMPYVAGRTLRERLEGQGPLSGSEGASILADVAAALAHAHAHHLVHRDVRPGNILLEQETGRAMLTDFGIAAVLDAAGMQADRLTQSGVLVGDPRYLSPEQLAEREVTSQTDMFQFGILGYEIFTGEVPEWVGATDDGRYPGRAPVSIALPDDLDARVADLIRRCLQAKPRHRPSALDALRTLRNGGSGGNAVRPREDGDLAEVVRRRVPQIVLLTGGAGITLIGLSDALEELLPPRSKPLVVAFVAAAVLASAVVGWFHGERGHQRAPLIEFVLLGLVAAGWILASWWVVF